MESPKTYPDVPSHVTVEEEPVTATLVSVGTSSIESDSKMSDEDDYFKKVIKNIKEIGCYFLKKITHEKLSINTILGSLIGGTAMAIPHLFLYNNDNIYILHNNDNIYANIMIGSLCGAVYFTSLRYIVYGKNKDIKTCCIFLNGIGFLFCCNRIYESNI